MVALLLSKVPDFKPIAPASLENYISEVSRLIRLALDQAHSLIRFVLVPRFSRKKANDSLVILKTIEKRIATLMTMKDVERELTVSGFAHEEALLLIRDAIRCITVATIAGSIDAARNLRLPDVRQLNRQLKVEAARAVDRLQSNTVRPQRRMMNKSVKRRRKSQQTVKPLTAKQAEALKHHGDCENNIAEVARRMGIDTSTARQHVQEAYKKLRRCVPTKAKTTSLKTDRRGQADVTKGDDHRG